MASTSLVYRCPHCEHEISVDPGFFDETVQCPECDRPIRIAPPTAYPADKQSSSTGDYDVSENSAGRERPLAAVHEHDPGEATLVRLHPAMFRNHPLHYVAYCALIALGFFMAIVKFTNGDYFTGIVSLICGLVGAVAMGIWALQVIYTTLTVTTKRTTLKFGIISRRSTEVQHDDIRNIQVNQSILDRIFGVGALAISSAGQAGLEILVDGITDPDGVADQIRAHQ